MRFDVATVVPFSVMLPSPRLRDEGVRVGRDICELAADVRAAADEVSPLDPGLVRIADAVLAGHTPDPTERDTLLAWSWREARHVSVN